MGCMYSTGMYIFYRYSKMASSLRSKHVGVCCKTLYILDSVHLMTSCWYTNLWTSRAWLWEAFFPPKGAPHTVDRPLASPIYHGVCSKTEPAPGPLDWAWTGKAVVFCATWNPRAEKHHSPLTTLRRLLCVSWKSCQPFNPNMLDSDAGEPAVLTDVLRSLNAIPTRRHRSSRRRSSSAEPGSIGRRRSGFKDPRPIRQQGQCYSSVFSVIFVGMFLHTPQITFKSGI